MNRAFYSDYVKHMMRFYARTFNIQPTFKTEVDKTNWHTCRTVIEHYNPIEQTIFISVYGGFDTLADEVYRASKEHSLNQSVIWDMMKDFERRIAKRRGLI